VMSPFTLIQMSPFSTIEPALPMGTRVTGGHGPDCWGLARECRVGILRYNRSEREHRPTRGDRLREHDGAWCRRGLGQRE
jgi:hypothetical protein